MNQKFKNKNLKVTKKMSRRRQIIGLSLWLMAVLLGLSFISYLFTWKDDQSLVLKGDRNSAHNIVGFLGAYLSHHSFYNGFGISAFGLVLLLFIWGYCFLAYGRLRLRKITFNICLIMFYGSVILAFLLPEKILESFPYSGEVGKLMNEFLRGIIGKIGAFIVLFIFAPVSIFGLTFLKRRSKRKVAVVSHVRSKDDLSKLHKVVLPEQPENSSSTTMQDLSFHPDNQAFSDINDAQVNGVAPGQSNQFNNNFFDVSQAIIPVPNEEDNVSSPIQEESSFKIIQKEPVIEPLVQNISLSPEIHLASENIQPAQPGITTDQSNELHLHSTPAIELQQNKENVSENKQFSQSPVQPSPINTELSSKPIQVIVKSPISTPPREGVYVSGIVAKNSLVSRAVAEKQEPNLNSKSLSKDVNPVATSPNSILQTTNKPVPNLTTSPTVGSIDGLYDPRADLSYYNFPSKELLNDYPENTHQLSDFEIKQNEQRIASLLRKFDIKFSTVNATVGPAVTLYEVATELTENLRKIENRAPNLAMALEAISVRIMIPVPGKSVVGIEVPNKKQSIVGLKNLLSHIDKQNTKAILPIAIGRTIDNMPFILDLVEMPHLLIAGATKQGKSVGINTILLSLLYRQHPAELKLVLIDPKQVELGIYELIERHYLAKIPSEEQAVIKDSKKAVYTLQALVLEMEHRLSLMSMARVRDIGGYNEKFRARQLNPKDGHKFLPFIVVVVDEYADLVMTEKSIEKPLIMLAQKARAAGIHLIVATQRPSADVLVGMIKANCPGRLAFRVAQGTDSRIILDENGAESLIGRGDMLVKTGDVGGVKRVQCAFVATEEVDAVVNFISKQQAYANAYELPEYSNEEEEDMGQDSSSQASMKRDSLFEEIARAVVRDQRVSASSLQARYSIGQPRATRIVFQLERAGIVSPLRAGKREVILSDIELEDLLDTLNNS